MVTAKKYYVNGRFLTAPQSGVQRTARELVRAIDQELTSDAITADWTLVTPAGALEAATDRVNLKSIKTLSIGGGRGAVWEQTVLPRVTKDGVLINLANSAPLTHKRNVVMFHDAQVHSAPASYSAGFRTWYRFMQPAVARRAVAVLTVSDFSAQQLRTFRVVRQANIAVIPNGVSDDWSDDRTDATAPVPAMMAPGAPAPNSYFIAFTSDAPHKNIALLLETFASPALADMTLFLVGDRLPEGRTPPPNVKVLGRVGDRDLKFLYQCATALLFPSRTEGFGLPPLEAMACGCPVIAARAGAVPEVCGDAAILLDPDDVDAWRTRARSLADNESERTRLAALGRDRAKMFSWRRSARKLLNLLESQASVSAG